MPDSTKEEVSQDLLNKMHELAVDPAFTDGIAMAALSKAYVDLQDTVAGP